MYNKIASLISDFGSVTIEVYSQYDSNCKLDSITTSNRNQAEDFFLAYSNDYVYVRPPQK